MKLFLTTLLVPIVGLMVCLSQPATIVLNNQYKTNSVILRVDNTYLFTQRSTFLLETVRSVSFWEEQPDSITVYILRKNGVSVYLKGKRLVPVDELESSLGYKSDASLGIGLGLDYGGFGLKLSGLTSQVIGVYIGLGSNLNGFGYNFGFDAKFSPRKRNTGFVTAMYGYNGVILANDYKETFNGFTVGIGLKTLSKSSDKSYLSGAILVPFRESRFKEIAKSNRLFYSPVLISLGYNFGFQRK